MITTALSGRPSLRWLAICALALLVATPACRDEERDGIGTVQDGELEIFPASISFEAIDIGERITEYATVSNIGDVDVRLFDLEFEPVTDGADEVFDFVNPFGDDLVLTEDEFYEFQVDYAPQDAQAHEAIIRFDTNLAGDDTVFEIEIRSSAPSPEMVADDTVIFERIPPDTLARQVTTVRNIGSAPLVVDDIYLTGMHVENFDLSFPTPIDELSSDDRTILEGQLPQGESIDDLDYAPENFDKDDAPEVIGPNEEAQIRVFFEAEDEDFRAAELVLETNDPTRQPSHRIAVVANSDSPCLELVGDTVDFGYAAMGSTTQQTVTLRNCSSIADTVITDMQMGVFDEDGDFVATDDIYFSMNEATLPGELADGGVASLDPNQSTSFVMTYAPEFEQPDEAAISIESTDVRSPLQTDVIGHGVDRECPVAHARVGIEGSGVWSEDTLLAVPLDNIAFDGSESYDPDDPDVEVSYEWTLIEEPLGSTATIYNANTVSPTLDVNIAGRFVVELMVYDEFGIAACDPAQVVIQVEPESAIHVELTWDVPTAADGVGTDLDLHYLHPNGQWSAEPYGVFWNNSNPNWNDGSSVSLDIDDLTGAEPENINHDNPDPNYDYHTGVYYFGDSANFGPTDARIRIYFHDSLVLELEERLENPGIGIDPNTTAGDFWYVARIGVTPSGPMVDLLEVIDELYVDSGFPELVED